MQTFTMTSIQTEKKTPESNITLSYNLIPKAVLSPWCHLNTSNRVQPSTRKVFVDFMGAVEHPGHLSQISQDKLSLWWRNRWMRTFCWPCPPCETTAAPCRPLTCRPIIHQECPWRVSTLYPLASKPWPSSCSSTWWTALGWGQSRRA